MPKTTLWIGGALVGEARVALAKRIAAEADVRVCVARTRPGGGPAQPVWQKAASAEDVGRAVAAAERDGAPFGAWRDTPDDAAFGKPLQEWLCARGFPWRRDWDGAEGRAPSTTFFDGASLHRFFRATATGGLLLHEQEIRLAADGPDPLAAIEEMLAAARGAARGPGPVAAAPAPEDGPAAPGGPGRR
jgi:hypothetical protein